MTAVLRCRVMAAALILLTAGLAVLVAAPQAALASPPGASSIVTGDEQTCAVDSGQAYCWGLGLAGELGNGTTTSSSVPVAVDTSGVLAGKTLTQISSSGGTTCAVDNAGAAYCWGTDAYWNLGNGTGGGRFDYSSVPVAVDTSGVLAGKFLTQISVGPENTCVLDSAGAAYCWGDNSWSELGDGSGGGDDGDYSSVPVAVDNSGVLAGKTLTQISVGADNTCVLDSAGAAYCWGNAGNGELGDGSTTASNVPVAVDNSGVLAGKTLTQITIGYGTACALDSAGAAYCWGADYYGTLGNGNSGSTDYNSSVPVAVDTSGVLAGKTLTQITVGVAYVCAVDSAGAPYCWGINQDGQLGDDTTNDSSVPVAVDNSGVLVGKTLTQISSTGASYHTCALDSAGVAYCWGYGQDGELGDDTTTAQSTVPVLVSPQAPTNLTGTAGSTTATMSWSAPVFLNGATVTGYTATASPGGATCTTTGGTACIIRGLTNGTTYTATVVAATTAGDSGASAPVTVVPVTSPGPGLDQTVTVTGTGIVTTPSFSTTAAGETLLAFVGSDGPDGAHKQTVTVKGAGLTWTMVSRANARAGDAEIWQATAPSVLTNVTVTSKQAKAGYDQDLTVIAVEGTNGVGATAAASAASGAPALSLTTTQANSLVFAVGDDWDNAVARTLPAGWVTLNQWLDTRTADTYWSQYTTAPIADAGTVVSVADAAPVSDRWNLAAVEVTAIGG